MQRFNTSDYICHQCGGRAMLARHTGLNKTDSNVGMCPRCGTLVIVGEWTIKVEGIDASEVNDVTVSLLDKIPKSEKISLKGTPWISGSFYLASILSIGTLFLITAKVIHPILLPIVIIGSLLSISVIGALQLRQDEKLNQKKFLELMALTFRQLPIAIWRKKEDHK